MPTRFAAVYYIRNNAGTYEAWQDNETAATYSGTTLVTDVLNPIEAANPTGGFVVLFGAGTFDMGNVNPSWNWTLTDVDDIMIAGAGMGTTVIQNDGGANANDTEPFSFTRANRVTIQDLTINALGSDRQSSDGLDFDNGNDNLVRRVHILAARGDGITIDGKDNLAEAVNNTIDSCIIGGTGSSIGFSGIQLLVTDRCRVINSHISLCGEAGIKINRQVSANRYSERNIISNNVIETNNEAGIEILECRDNIVSHNVIRNNGQTAGTDDGVLIDDFGNAGLECERNVIANNVFQDTQSPSETQDTGVRVADASSTDNLIIGNTFAGHITAAVSDSGTTTLIRSNIGVADSA